MACRPKMPQTALPPLPEMPPPTAEKLAVEQQITDNLRKLVEQLRQRCLDNAVLLAQQAARGHGPLVDHFIEIGRRYGETLATAPSPKLRAIKGGRS